MKYKYEYPLLSPNVRLYRKNGKNPINLYAYWDGSDTLEIYRTSDDGGCSLISLDIRKDEYIYWYSCKRQKPNVTGYRLKVLRDIFCPKRNNLIFNAGEEFRGFELLFSGGEDD